MKKLEINGRTLYYKLRTFGCGEYGAANCTVTDFFIKSTTKVLKYWLWGPMVEVETMKPVFGIDFSIESETKTKDEVRTAIEKKLVLLDRKEEIEKGNII